MCKSIILKPVQNQFKRLLPATRMSQVKERWMCCTDLYNEHIWVGLLVGSQIWAGLSRLRSLYWELHPLTLGLDLLPVLLWFSVILNLIIRSLYIQVQLPICCLTILTKANNPPQSDVSIIIFHYFRTEPWKSHKMLRFTLEVVRKTWNNTILHLLDSAGICEWKGFVVLHVCRSSNTEEWRGKVQIT